MCYRRKGKRLEKIIDLSHNNIVTSWQLVKTAVSGVIIRIGYRGYSAGSIKYDNKFKEFLTAAKAAGIPVAFYFFPCSISDAEAIEEADFIYNAIHTENMFMPVMLDSEVADVKFGHGRADHLDPQQRTRYIKVICDRLASRGITAGVYGSTSWLNNRLIMSQLQYPIWVAQYGSRCKYTGTYFAWQFTDRANVPGIAKPCDMSYFYGLSGMQIQKVGKVQTYKVGNTYTLQANMYVRKAPGGEKKPYKDLTEDGKKNGKADISGCGVLNKGAKITALQVAEKYSATWIRTPSGWICAIGADKKMYIK